MSYDIKLSFLLFFGSKLNKLYYILTFFRENMYLCGIIINKDNVVYEVEAHSDGRDSGRRIGTCRRHRLAHGCTTRRRSHQGRVNPTKGIG